MRGVLLGAVLIFVLMLVIKDGRASRNLGLTGSCHAITAPKGQDGAWFGCVAGKLEGAPDLGRQGCRSMSFVGKRENWRCPAGINQPRHLVLLTRPDLHSEKAWQRGTESRR